MILLISQNHIEEPTNDIIDWLRYFKYDNNFIRLNGEEFYINSDFDICYEQNSYIKNQKISISSNDINVVFYRRWYQNKERYSLFETFTENNFKNEDALLVNSFLTYLNLEYVNSVNSIYNTFRNAYWVPSISIVRKDISKSEALQLASKNGLLTPETIITTNKESVINFKNKHLNIITKSIKDMYLVTYHEYEMKMFTKVVSDDDIANMPAKFFPSLYQQQINKIFELRIFFIENDFFSMAIFSQNDEKTKVDFRNYNLKKPNRNVPFNLPDDIKNKLKKTMDDLQLNTGSIDMIVDDKHNYYFIEVNPVGQLGMVSEGGNYYIEKIITQKLIDNDRRKSFQQA